MENEIPTGDFNPLLVLPSGITLLVIFALLGLPKFRNLFSRNRLILCLLIALIVLNLIEVITYGNLIQADNILLRAYYSVSIFATSLFIYLCGNLSNLKTAPYRYFYLVIFAFGMVLIALVTTSDLIVSGAVRSSYSISRNPGELYWVFQLFILSCVGIGPALIFKNIKTTDNPLEKKRNTVILFSFIPIVATVSIVILLMQLGLNITLAFIFPFSTLIFILVYLYTENKNDLFRFLVNVPFSKERKAYKELNSRVLNFISKTQTNEIVPLKKLLSDIERSFISNALEVKDGDHNLAAELLSISISTIYRNKNRKEE